MSHAQVGLKHAILLIQSHNSFGQSVGDSSQWAQVRTSFMDLWILIPSVCLPIRIQILYNSHRQHLTTTLAMLSPSRFHCLSVCLSVHYLQVVSANIQQRRRDTGTLDIQIREHWPRRKYVARSSGLVRQRSSTMTRDNLGSIRKGRRRRKRKSHNGLAKVQQQRSTKKMNRQRWWLWLSWWWCRWQCGGVWSWDW